MYIRRMIIIQCYLGDVYYIQLYYKMVTLDTRAMRDAALYCA